MGESWTSHTCVESFLDSGSLFLLPFFNMSPTLSLFLNLSSTLDETEREKKEKFFDGQDKKERGSGMPKMRWGPLLATICSIFISLLIIFATFKLFKR